MSRVCAFPISRAREQFGVLFVIQVVAIAAEASLTEPSTPANAVMRFVFHAANEALAPSLEAVRIAWAWALVFWRGVL